MSRRQILIALDSVGIDPLGHDRPESVYGDGRFLFPRGEHGAMARAGMVAMAMGNHGLVDRTRRIDMETAERAVHPALRRQNNVLQPH